MTLSELRFIVALAHEKNFRKAAEKSFVSQPALSLGIKKIEDELSIAIFERSVGAGGDVKITPVGQKIIEQASIIRALNHENLSDPEIGREMAKYLQLRLNTIESNLWEVGYDFGRLIIIKKERGVTQKYEINNEFLITPEAKSLNDLRNELMENFGILKNSCAGIIKHISSEYKINGPLDLIEKVLEMGKSGIQVNRYKGLGEMNPDQLWETTLDRNFRSLLLVKIEEVNEANALFETLMGDVVEGRRNFIQENSLKVANLDI